MALLDDIIGYLFSIAFLIWVCTWFSDALKHFLDLNIGLVIGVCFCIAVLGALIDDLKDMEKRKEKREGHKKQEAPK